MSAIGSRRVPSVVISPRRRASQPSKKSVAVAKRKISSPTVSRPSNFVRRTTRRNGTRKMRRSVSAFGRLMFNCSSVSRISMRYLSAKAEIREVTKVTPASRRAGRRSMP